MIKVSATGNLNKTMTFLQKISKFSPQKYIEQCAKDGVTALQVNTPIDTGETATSWDYKITYYENGATITWVNTNLTENNIPIPILIQYGHATNGGGYVQGIDFINPALKPIIDRLADKLSLEVTNL